MKNTPPIAVFDSGVGGLSVWREIARLLPEADLLYLADQAHAPYGHRSLDEIRRLTFAACDFLRRSGAGLIVLACNTASAAALHPLRDAFPDVPFVGMEPAVKPAAASTRTGAIGVLATEATFQGEMFASVVRRFAGHAKVLTRTCPGLVERIEAGGNEEAEMLDLLRGWIAPLLAEGADRLVLGCTHFPLIRGMIAAAAGDGVEIVDPSPAVAAQAQRLWRERAGSSVSADGTTAQGWRRFLTTAPAGHALADAARRHAGLDIQPERLHWREGALTPA